MDRKKRIGRKENALPLLLSLSLSLSHPHFPQSPLQQTHKAPSIFDADSHCFNQRIASNFFSFIALFSVSVPSSQFSIPSRIDPSFDQDAFALRILTADTQSFLIRDHNFDLPEETHLALHDGASGVSALLMYITFGDLAARGYSRAFCLAYVTYDSDKIMCHIDDMLDDLTHVAALLKYGNRSAFLADVRSRKADLRHTLQVSMDAASTAATGGSTGTASDRAAIEEQLAALEDVDRAVTRRLESSPVLMRLHARHCEQHARDAILNGLSIANALEAVSSRASGDAMVQFSKAGGDALYGGIAPDMGDARARHRKRLDTRDRRHSLKQNATQQQVDGAAAAGSAAGEEAPAARRGSRIRSSTLAPAASAGSPEDDASAARRSSATTVLVAAAAAAAALEAGGRGANDANALFTSPTSNATLRGAEQGASGHLQAADPIGDNTPMRRAIGGKLVNDVVFNEAEHTPRLMDVTKARNFKLELRPVGELAGVFFAEALGALNKVREHYHRRLGVLALEQKDALLLAPASSLLTIGRCVVLNFHLATHTVDDGGVGGANHEDDLTIDSLNAIAGMAPASRASGQRQGPTAYRTLSTSAVEAAAVEGLVDKDTWSKGAIQRPFNTEFLRSQSPISELSYLDALSHTTDMAGDDDSDHDTSMLSFLSLPPPEDSTGDSSVFQSPLRPAAGFSAARSEPSETAADAPPVFFPPGHANSAKFLPLPTVTTASATESEVEGGASQLSTRRTTMEAAPGQGETEEAATNANSDPGVAREGLPRHSNRHVAHSSDGEDVTPTHTPLRSGPAGADDDNPTPTQTPRREERKWAEANTVQVGSRARPRRSLKDRRSSSSEAIYSLAGRMEPSLVSPTESSSNTPFPPTPDPDDGPVRLRLGSPTGDGTPLPRPDGADPQPPTSALLAHGRADPEAPARRHLLRGLSTRETRSGSLRDPAAVPGAHQRSAGLIPGLPTAKDGPARGSVPAAGRKVLEGLRESGFNASKHTKHAFQSAADHLAHPSTDKPGSGMLALRDTYSFLPHIVYALLSGRCVFVVAKAEREAEVRRMVTALWFCVPGHSISNRVVAWRSTSRLAPKFTELSTLKLVGLSRAVAGRVPHAVLRQVGIMDLDAGTFSGIQYHGHYVSAMLDRQLHFPSDAALLAHMHDIYLQLACKAFLYYHDFCLRIDNEDAPVLLHEVCSPRHDDLKMQTFFKNIAVFGSDMDIVRYLAETVKRQQEVAYMKAMGLRVGG